VAQWKKFNWLTVVLETFLQQMNKKVNVSRLRDVEANLILLNADRSRL